MSDETPSQVDLVGQLYDENQKLKDRIKRLEEAAGSNKLKAADDHIRALKIIISRASTAFFCDGSDGQVASRMFNILGEASKPMTCEDKDSKP
jgi:ABC-type enterochelin transport system substrate-binding protein